MAGTQADIAAINAALAHPNPAWAYGWMLTLVQREALAMITADLATGTPRERFVALAKQGFQFPTQEG